MEIIRHRINTIDELQVSDLGVELDIRDMGDQLVLCHDPFIWTYQNFEEYLKVYPNKGTMILNIKSEGVEYKVKDLMDKYKISNYFFLDSTVPMIYKLNKLGEYNCAIRFSELESLENLKLLKGNKWVWVDCFSKFMLSKEIEETIHKLGYKICLVSPELQSRKEDIDIYKSIIKSEKIKIDAVCTKFPEKWKRISISCI